MSLLALSCRLFGTRFTALWLHPIVAYFLLTGRRARAASRNYFTHLQQAAPQDGTPRPGWLSAYRHMLAFAQSGFDKLAAWSGRVNMADVKFDDPAAFEALSASGRGALVIGAHLGNLEMTRALATRGAHAKVTAIVYTEHARRFNSVLASANSNFAQRLVEVSDFGPETAMMMQDRVDAGELLVIVGDRVPAHDAGRTTEAQFLGSTAPFAQGPYVLAHALGCPVYLFFCLKERAAATGSISSRSRSASSCRAANVRSISRRGRSVMRRVSNTIAARRLINGSIFSISGRVPMKAEARMAEHDLSGDVGRANRMQQLRRS